MILLHAHISQTGRPFEMVEKPNCRTRSAVFYLPIILRETNSSFELRHNRVVQSSCTIYMLLSKDLFEVEKKPNCAARSALSDYCNHQIKGLTKSIIFVITHNKVWGKRGIKLHSKECPTHTSKWEKQNYISSESSTTDKFHLLAPHISLNQLFFWGRRGAKLVNKECSILPSYWETNSYFQKLCHHRKVRSFGTTYF